jgi:hypothetical protein
MMIEEVVSWITNQSIIDNRMIKYENEKSIASFHPSGLDIYSKFPK